MAEPAIGTVFAGHRIEGFVGRGGMGVVYLARHIALDRRVALKLIADELAAEPGFRERFKRESRIAAALDHPNVVPVHHAGEEDGLLFITMRWIDGFDLRGLILRTGGLESMRAARIVSQVGAALDAAHAGGLVHRDVKPANILIAEEGGRDHAYLTDFGLTKRDTSINLTDTGAIVGTLDYVAPEQIRGEAVDARTDVYGLGCVLFHALTGDVPFPADSYASKVYCHLSEDPPEIDGGPPELNAVIRKAMAKDPAERYQSAGELGAAAVAAATGRPTKVRHTVRAPVLDPTPTTPSIRELAPPRRRWPLVAALAVLVAVAAVAGALVGLSGGGGEVTRAEVKRVLDAYQVALTNRDVASLDDLLAPDFTRKVLADPPMERAEALDEYRAAFEPRGAQPRYSLQGVDVQSGDGAATATARFSYTGGAEPHLGDYGVVVFRLEERDGEVQIASLETYPDVVALLPPSLGRDDFPVEATVTATYPSRGEQVPIAEATSRLAEPPDAVIVPLNQTGRRIVRTGREFTVRMRLRLADGRVLPVVPSRNRFVTSATEP